MCISQQRKKSFCCHTNTPLFVVLLNLGPRRYLDHLPFPASALSFSAQKKLFFVAHLQHVQESTSVCRPTRPTSAIFRFLVLFSEKTKQIFFLAAVLEQTRKISRFLSFGLPLSPQKNNKTAN
jgi:hypothetical protein